MAATPCSCCGSDCCPDTAVPDEIPAEVTSGCPAINGTVIITRIPGTFRWVGRVTVSGCHDCTVLEVFLECEHVLGVYQWGLGWNLYRTNGVTLCVVFNVDGTSEVTSDCGPPLHVTLTQTHLFLQDDTLAICCSDFTVTIDVVGVAP